ncbi:MAG TPA: hypothetical protein VMT91_14760 [Anaerolineales bacterium]|nr:hypothetical protein [Anaerolineales bacterium]
MARNKLLPALTLVLALLAACSAQSSPATPILQAATPAAGTPVPSLPAAPVPSATERPSPPALPAVAAPTLAHIDFQDSQDGWGLAIDGKGHVLRTVDGGSTWLDATPPGIGNIGLTTVLSVLDTNHAWVLVPGTDFFSGSLYRTRDGGLSWSSNTLPFGGAYLQFIDSNTGRALAERGARAGSEAVELFQTLDGGASWTSVFHDDPGQPGASDSLPLAGIKNGMTFLDGNTGWVTGSSMTDGDIYLYVTHDGGVSWSQQSVPLPAGYQAERSMPQAPVFFGKQGFLPLTIYLPGKAVLSFYTSLDGGATWNGDPAEAGKTIRPGLVAFSDASHGYCWDGGPIMYQISDGARTWTQLATHLDLSGELAQMEFVPDASGPPAGWALTQVNDSGHSQLYQIAAGLQWKPVNP